jgi:CNT family concentrative nucleoside transporter
MKEGVIADPRSPVLAAYALCGFAHVASMAIFVGGAAALAPSRKRDIASVGFRALVAATLACLMTACIAGVFFMGKSALLG